MKDWLYPPDHLPEVRGYGRTLSQRFPKLSSQEVGQIESSHTSRMALMVVALLTGLACGAAATLLKLCIGTVGRWLTVEFSPTSNNWWLIGLPMIGLLISDIYQRYIIRKQISHGEGRLRNDFARNACYLPIAITYSPILAATATLGFGGSAGSEGPIAYTGGAIGSNIAGWFRLSPATVRAMTAIGAGAGIAGIFKAPVGGALFTIEVLGIGMNIVAVGALFVACTSSGLTAYLLSGRISDIAFSNSLHISWGGLPMVVLLGIVCGVYSYYYSSTMSLTRKGLMKINNHWVKNITAGLFIGLSIFLFPPLYGEGYGAVAHLLNGDFTNLLGGSILRGVGSVPVALALTAAGILVVKSFATSATNNGGGVAGNFAPTIMIGSVVGFLFAFACNQWWGMDLPIPDFVFMGMAGILAGAIHAPLMAMFLVTEMATMGYQQMLPVAIVASLSYITVCALQHLFSKTSAH